MRILKKIPDSAQTRLARYHAACCKETPSAHEIPQRTHLCPLQATAAATPTPATEEQEIAKCQLKVSCACTEHLAAAAMGLALALVAIIAGIFIALFFLLVAGVIYFEFANSDIPPGVANPAKLRIIHCIMIGIAVVGKIAQNMFICSQLDFTRFIRDKLLARRLGEDPKLLIKNLNFEGIPVRVYQPKSPSAGGRKGVLFFHGGGWMFGSIDSYDVLCRYISKGTESVVVSVGYRLAPEHKYPAAFDDCLKATRHFLKNAREYGIDPSSVVISGDSAGGNLTAAVCQALVGTDLPKPLAQVLIYPAVQGIDFHLPSYTQNCAVPILYRERAVFYMINYIEGNLQMMEEVLDGDHVPVDLKLKFKKWLGLDNIPDEFKVRGIKHPLMASHSEDVYKAHKQLFETYFSPLLAEDSVFRLLPKAYVLTCEFDVLRDDGILYKKRLEDNGVPVTWFHLKDGFHGIVSFFDNGKLTFESGKLAVDNIVKFINDV
ncbi:arylacetamide deacetylase-like 4 [Dendrobates tinctorius]|uniref:arylacetamide deacetylase-like 4 n=1 Tax=Dendrobates tinctorius TaxID=92724 RepID=UPI003CC97C5B